MTAMTPGKNCRRRAAGKARAEAVVAGIPAVAGASAGAILAAEDEAGTAGKAKVTRIARKCRSCSGRPMASRWA